MNVAPHRHHRFLGNRAFVLDGMLTDARESGLGFVGGDESCKSDNSEVIAASSECSPITMRWVDQEVDIGTRGVFAT
ncbi:hypothetical protein [Bradyrhizobium sp. 151]|uniref:hypothetical protein n=1 Tax=Bradyrhizobium sp. 151 TaxID=2782626 RepID=UPI001FF9E549|nr:hypothetical protein [Bradyrhizobium sp. 151]